MLGSIGSMGLRAMGMAKRIIPTVKPANNNGKFTYSNPMRKPVNKPVNNSTKNNTKKNTNRKPTNSTKKNLSAPMGRIAGMASGSVGNLASTIARAAEVATKTTNSAVKVAGEAVNAAITSSGQIGITGLTTVGTLGKGAIEATGQIGEAGFKATGKLGSTAFNVVGNTGSKALKTTGAITNKGLNMTKRIGNAAMNTTAIVAESTALAAQQGSKEILKQAGNITQSASYLVGSTVTTITDLFGRLARGLGESSRAEKFKSGARNTLLTSTSQHFKDALIKEYQSILGTTIIGFTKLFQDYNVSFKSYIEIYKDMNCDKGYLW